MEEDSRWGLSRRLFVEIFMLKEGEGYRGGLSA
jgi:hypothetical protein